MFLERRFRHRLEEFEPLAAGAVRLDDFVDVGGHGWERGEGRETRAKVFRF
jgi:hypothetical protein